MTNPEQAQKIAQIGEALHRSGCAPYKVEKYVQHYARKLGVTVVVQATPTSVSFQFPEEDNQILMRRMDPAGIDLGLLARTIIRIHRNDDTGIDVIPHPTWLIALANIAIPPIFLILVGSSLQAIGFAAMLGVLVWLCQLICQGERANFVEFLSALIVGISVAAISAGGADVPVWGLCIAAVVLFVPGLSIANALECLAFNDLISGTSLFAQAIFIFTKLFIGIFIGLNIGETIFGAGLHADNVNEVIWWWPIVALPVFSLALGVIFNARLIDIALALPVTALGLWGPVWLGFGAGWITGTWVTAMCITLYGTWVAKKMNLTGAIYIMPGILLLVPGSRVLFGATQSLFNESLMPVQGVGLSAFLMFAAIVAGQITALSLYSQKNRNLVS